MKSFKKEVLHITQFKIYYRIGIAGEKTVLFDEQIKDSYYGVCVGANVAAFGKNWVSHFFKTIDKPFFIDPMTHVLQFDTDFISREGELRKSYSRLFSEYGITIPDSNGHLNPDEFKDELLEQFVAKVVDFQKNITQSTGGSQQSLLDYAKLLGDSIPVDAIYPEFLIAPYFFFENTTDNWYALNIRILEKSKARTEKLPIYGLVCISLDVLQNDAEISTIIDDYAIMDGIVLWISELNEYRMNRDELVAFLELTQRLHERVGHCIILYGGYFSMLSSKMGLCGISPGIGISEFKRVKDQPTGGTFSNKYYIPEVKTMIVEADARTFYVDNPTTLCNCEICKGIEISTVEGVHNFFDGLSPFKAKSHYCINRSIELEKIETLSFENLQDIINADIKFCETRIGGTYNIPFGHLYSWKFAITEFLRKVEMQMTNNKKQSLSLSEK